MEKRRYKKERKATSKHMKKKQKQACMVMDILVMTIFHMSFVNGVNLFLDVKGCNGKLHSNFLPNTIRFPSKECFV